MRSRLRKWIGFLLASPLFRDAGVYAGSHLASKAVPFLLLPILTRYLSPADYGIVAMFLLVATLVEPFIGIGLSGAVTVKYYDKSTDLPAYIGTGLVVVLAASVPIVLLLAVFGEPISGITAVPTGWLYFVVLYVLCRVVVGVVMALWRVQRRPFVFGLFINMQSAAILGGSLVLVVAFGRQWRGRVEAEIAALAASAVVAFIYLWRSGWIRSIYDRAHASHLLRFGVPLIPHALGAVLMAQTDRLFVTNMIGVDETGLYTVGYQLALLIELANISFNNAYAPWLYSKLSKADDAMKLKLVRYTYVHFVGLCLFAIAIALVMPWFATTFLDDQFAGSAAYVYWFAVGFACSGMYYMVANYIFYAEKTVWLAVVTLSTALINIPLTYGLIKLNGAIGAAQATAAALALSFLFTWAASARAYPMPWAAPFRRRALR